jgi:hypothetical protein
MLGLAGRPRGGRADERRRRRSPLREDGTFEIRFRPEADEREAGAGAKDITYRYAVSADVTDEGGETRSAARSFRLGFVSIEAAISSETSFFRGGEAGSLTIRRTNLDGTPKAGEGRWKLFTLEQPNGALLPAEQPVEELPEERRDRPRTDETDSASAGTRPTARFGDAPVARGQRQRTQIRRAR